MRRNEPMRLSISILWGVVISLFILNLALLYTLNVARLTAIEALGQAETTLDKLAKEVVVYDVRINQAVPLKADVPFNQRMDIPIKTVIPIDQEMKLPLDTPAGQIMLNVPVKADFPIDTVVPVDFNQTIKVDTVVQLDTTVPVEIAVAKTPLVNYLKQARLDVARLKSRLSFQGEAAAAEETGPVSSTNATASPDSVANTTEEAVAAEPGAKASASDAGASPSAEGVASVDNSATKVDLGKCAHPYWPLQPGVTWTYNSPDTSYPERVETVSADQVALSSQYEGRDIRFNVACRPEGLGGSYLGDMRRISEFGDLHFDNPRGVFLPRPEIMEAAGASWAQAFDVSGMVKASQGDQLIEGKITRGRAEAVYTPTGFDRVETPLGPQKSLRVEQKLNLELNINFNINGQTVPAVQTVNLTNVYWFVEDMGLVKMHWQGGQLQREVKLAQSSVDWSHAIPALAEDKLVFVCTMEQQAPGCQRVTDVSEADLTEPPASELELPGFELPAASSVAESVKTEEVVTDNKGSGGASSNGGSGPGNQENPEPPAGPGDDLLRYGTAVADLSQKMSDAAQNFGGAALAYHEGSLTGEEFHNKYSDFAPKVKQLISQINRLTPPPQANQVHQKLTSGLAKCTKALELLDQWFDKPDSGAKEAGVLLVTDCVADVTEAQDELDALMAGS